MYANQQVWPMCFIFSTSIAIFSEFCAFDLCVRNCMQCVHQSINECASIFVCQAALVCVFLLDLFWLVWMWFVFVVAMIFLCNFFFLLLCLVGKTHYAWIALFTCAIFILIRCGMAQWRLHTHTHTLTYRDRNRDRDICTTIGMLIKFWVRIHVPLQLNFIQCIFISFFFAVG